MSRRMLPGAILFDLDDTLFDHQHASSCALLDLHARYAGGSAYDAFAREHARVLEKYHVRFLDGEFTLDGARAARMVELFASFGERLDDARALEIALRYRELHQGNRRLVEGAHELLDALQGQAKLAVVTNNSVPEQWSKLRHLRIAEYFAAVVISEEVGVTKPAREISLAALARLDCRAHEAVMIGDNWEFDIVGARQAGIPAVWFNRFGTPHPAPEAVPEIVALHPVDEVFSAMQQAHARYTTKNQETIMGTPNDELATLAP
jgi:HAD superfamily hydrolase (TIGR01549 family)